MARKTTKFLAVFILFAIGLTSFCIWKMNLYRDNGNSEARDLPVGEVVRSYKSVPVYQNGKVVATSHGKHYAKSGYYYGQKWQCVEYVKRFYYDALSHKMPSVWGHAADFFDPEVQHGEINPARGMLQYQNGESIPPQPDDLIVFRHSKYGHVAIVTKVTEDQIEVIQQNVYGSPSAVYPIIREEGKYTVGSSLKPAGWLRLPQ